MTFTRALEDHRREIRHFLNEDAKTKVFLVSFSFSFLIRNGHVYRLRRIHQNKENRRLKIPIKKLNV